MEQLSATKGWLSVSLSILPMALWIVGCFVAASLLTPSIRTFPKTRALYFEGATATDYEWILDMQSYWSQLDHFSGNHPEDTARTKLSAPPALRNYRQHITLSRGYGTALAIRTQWGLPFEATHTRKWEDLTIFLKSVRLSENTTIMLPEQGSLFLAQGPKYGDGSTAVIGFATAGHIKVLRRWGSLIQIAIDANIPRLETDPHPLFKPHQVDAPKYKRHSTLRLTTMQWFGQGETVNNLEWH